MWSTVLSAAMAIKWSKAVYPAYAVVAWLALSDGTAEMAADNPVVAVGTLAALVAVTYGLMELVKLLVRRVTNGRGGDPVVVALGRQTQVLEEICDELRESRSDFAAVASKVDDLHGWIDLPHPLTPGFQSFAAEVRSNTIDAMRVAHASSEKIEDLRREVRHAKATACPLRTETQRERRERLQRFDNADHEDGEG